MAIPVCMGGLSPTWIYLKQLWEPVIYFLQNFGQVPITYRINCKVLIMAFNKVLVILLLLSFVPNFLLLPSTQFMPQPILTTHHYPDTIFLLFLPYLFIVSLWILPCPFLLAIVYPSRPSSDLRCQLHPLWQLFLYPQM